MKNLLEVDGCKFGEDNKFGLIEVYPNLHYSESDESNEIDLQELFQESLSDTVCKVNIHVRSKDAQEEIMSWLIGYGFEKVKCVCGDIIGQFECLEVRNNPQERQYYKSSDELKLLMTTSNLSLVVEFESDRVGEFKKVIKLLRNKKLYRNKWINEDGSYLIK